MPASGGTTTVGGGAVWQTLSPKQQEIRARDAVILKTAREMLLSRGYFGMTMDRIAEVALCPKGTMYQRFQCKEDIICALAFECLEERLAMMRRGASFAGCARQRMTGVGEGIALFNRLRPDDSSIIHIGTGPIREKASVERLRAMAQNEHATVDLVRGILAEAVAEGNLVPEDGASLQEITFALWSLVEGGFRLRESGIPQRTLGMANPVQGLWWVFNRLADAYGWRPLFGELDYEETLAETRRTIFPEEAQAIYGEEAWYGDAGTAHRAQRRSG